MEFLTSAFVLFFLGICHAAPSSSRSTDKGNEMICPAADLIAPCRCVSYPRNFVECDAVRDMDVLRNLLVPHFSKALPKLKLSNLRNFEFPEFAFENLRIRRLYITNSTFKFHPNALANLETLGLLALYNNRLESVPIEALQKVDHIETLSLVGNALTKLDKTSFQGLRKLKTLILNDNKLKQIEIDAFPKTLEFLHISGNRLTSLKGFLRNLSNLKWLTAARNKIESIRDHLNYNKKLQLLDLSFNKLSNLRNSFNNLSYLEELNLAENDIPFIRKYLDPLTNLKTLSLSGNYLTEAEETYGALKHLRQLDLSHNFISELSENFSKPLKKMRILKISHNDLTHVDKDFLKTMPDLITIDLSYNQLQSLGWETGFNDNLKTMLLHHNRLNSLAYEDFKGMSMLRRLDVSHNNIVELSKALFRLNKEMKFLNLARNPLKCSDDTKAALHMLERRKTEIKGVPNCFHSAINSKI